MTGDVHGRGCMHDRGVCVAGGHVGQGACVVGGGMCGRGAVDGAHPTPMQLRSQ